MGRAIRKLLLFLVFGSLAYFGVRELYRALASPETKIRWRMEAMVDGFNTMRAKPVFDGIAMDFVDRSSDVTREDLHSILAWAFLNEVDAQGEFLWNAVFDPKQMTIALAPDKHSAAVECRMQFFHRSGAQTKLEWDAHVSGTFTLGEDGWQWKAVDSENHAERHSR